MKKKMKMEETDKKPPPRYRWPWFVLAAFLVFVALAIFWMCFEVRTVERERNPNAPLPTGRTN